MKTKLCLIVLLLCSCCSSKETRKLRWSDDTNVASWDVYLDGKLYKHTYLSAVQLPKKDKMDVEVVAIDYYGTRSRPAYVIIRGTNITTLVVTNK